MKQVWKTLIELFGVLPSGAKPFYIGYSIVTGALAILDTVALALVVLVITPFASGDPITIPLIGEIPESGTVWVVLVICGLFILKGVLALALHWYATRRFARYELQVGNQLFRSFAQSSWEDRSKISTAEVTRIIDLSMANTNLGFILPLSTVPGNALTFISVLMVLVIAQPLTALLAFVYLMLVAYLVLILVNKHIRLAGEHNRKFGFLVARIMTEMIEALKEITLRGSLDQVGEVISKNRSRATRARANLSFLALIPKYTLEASLIGGFLLIGGVMYAISGPAAAVVSVGLFAATGFRMLPALNGVQSSLNNAVANQVYARDVITYVNAAHETDKANTKILKEDAQRLTSSPKNLTLADVDFTYPGSEQPAISHANLHIPFGTQLAIVGPSGAGKSTLVDLILGLSQPSNGALRIDGIELDDVLQQWRSRVGYVPQRVALFDGSIAQNVALTWSDDFDPEKVMIALKRAQLDELLERPGGINEIIGERGSALSGGQQQRLGIARALYSDPLVLVMDEATSALDTATENRVSEALRSLQGEMTFITIAHRLSTIRHYEQVCYVESGEVIKVGTFDEVVASVPQFAHQAALAGLTEISD